MLTVLKTAAGLAALMLVLLALIAAIGGLVGFVRRAIRGPGHRPTGLPEPPNTVSRGGEETGRRPPAQSG